MYLWVQRWPLLSSDCWVYIEIWHCKVGQKCTSQAPEQSKKSEFLLFTWVLLNLCTPHSLVLLIIDVSCEAIISVHHSVRLVLLVLVFVLWHWDKVPDKQTLSSRRPFERTGVFLTSHRKFPKLSHSNYLTSRLVKQCRSTWPDL